MLVVAELLESSICRSVECDLLKLLADLIELLVELLSRFVQLHELVEGADLELGLVYL